jgi:ElaA protein
MAERGDALTGLRVVPARAGERAPCFEIRRRVFIEEQGVATSEELDGQDDACFHWLAFLGAEPVGTARLRASSEGWKAERVAVLPAARRHGVGEALMRALEAEAWRRGAAEVVLHAQTAVIPFYERLGYTAEGPVFDEAGIPHRLMRIPRSGRAS